MIKPPFNPAEFEAALRSVQKPGRYSGGEWNAVRKDPSRVSLKVALAFPDLYEVGMSYLGQRILYFLLNERDDVLAERVFAPAQDFEAALRGRNQPLVSLENRIPLYEFDILGFSLSYELNYTNLVTILDLGRIPVYTSGRDRRHPLVLAGGPAVFNPEPLADFIDAFVIGDGEEVIAELLQPVREWKKSRMGRTALLESLTRIPGVYVPSLTETCRSPESHLLAVRPGPAMSFPVRKRRVAKLENTSFPTRIIVPNLGVVFDRVSVETTRGCPQNCRFCQARTLYFPERLRPADGIRDLVLESVRATGYEDVSLAALSVGDHPDLEVLVSELMRTLSQTKTALSLSSLRPRNLTPDIAENILRVRKTGFTLVPEAGTDRLRAVINKHLTESEILEAVDTAFRNGWRRLKLYFMVGLPTETDEDLRGIGETVRRIVGRGREILGNPPQVNLSVASFIPKPHTPFQWAAMNEKQELLRKHRWVREDLKPLRTVKVKPHQLECSLLEAVFSRGDRRLGRVLWRAWSGGARFDGWSDCFRPFIWQAAFEGEGIDPSRYLEAFKTDWVLPWDHIDTGVHKSYLLREYRNALEGRPTPPCHPRLCSSCRGCDSPLRSPGRKDRRIPEPKVSSSPDPIFPLEDRIRRYRIVYAKQGIARYISHRDLAALLQRAFRRAGIPVEYTQGFHPKMRMSFAPALPLGMAGDAELLEFRTKGRIPDKSLPELLTPNLPEGVSVVSALCLSSDFPSISENIEALEYDLRLDDPEIESRLTELNGGRKPSSTKRRRLAEALIGKNLESVKDPVCAEAEFTVSPTDPLVHIRIKVVSGRAPRVQDLVREIFSLARPPVFALTRTGIRTKGDSRAGKNS